MVDLETAVQNLFTVSKHDHTESRLAPATHPQQQQVHSGVYVSTGNQDMRLRTTRTGPMSEQLRFRKPGLTTQIEYAPQDRYIQIAASTPIVPDPTRGPAPVGDNIDQLQHAYESLTKHYHHDQTQNIGLGDQEARQVTFTGETVQDQNELDEAVTNTFNAGRFNAISEDYSKTPSIKIY
mgnify:FL=1